jgi:hypothetical protein
MAAGVRDHPGGRMVNVIDAPRRVPLIALMKDQVES